MSDAVKTEPTVGENLAKVVGETVKENTNTRTAISELPANALEAHMMPWERRALASHIETPADDGKGDDPPKDSPDDPKKGEQPTDDDPPKKGTETDDPPKEDDKDPPENKDDDPPKPEGDYVEITDDEGNTTEIAVQELLDNYRPGNYEHEVVVNGETIKVKQKDLPSGFMRNESFTQARQRESAEHQAVVTAMQETLADLQQQRQEVIDLLGRLNPSEPDWDAIKRERPAEFEFIFSNWNAQQKLLNKVTKDRDAENEKQRQKTQLSFVKRVEREGQLLVDHIPEWSDNDVRNKDFAEIGQFLIDTYGFTGEQLEGVYDHRLLRLFRDLHASSKLATRVKEVKSAPKKNVVLRPGGKLTQVSSPASGSVSKLEKDVKKAVARAQVTQRIDDWATAQQLRRQLEDAKNG